MSREMYVNSHSLDDISSPATLNGSFTVQGVAFLIVTKQVVFGPSWHYTCVLSSSFEKVSR